MPLKIAEPGNFILKTKWGCDGASGQAQYKQRFENSFDDDAGIFMINIVPLELINEDTGCTVRENTTPSSTNYCRPVKFQLIKESAILIKNEISAIQNEIEELNTSKCCIDTTEVTVKHHLILSMIDGKVVNAICKNKSSMTCYICNAKPTEMNQLENIYKKMHVRIIISTACRYYTPEFAPLNAFCTLRTIYHLNPGMQSLTKIKKRKRKKKKGFKENLEIK